MILKTSKKIQVIIKHLPRNYLSTMSASRSLAAYHKIMGIIDNSIRQAESLLNDLRDMGASAAVESVSDGMDGMREKGW